MVKSKAPSRLTPLPLTAAVIGAGRISQEHLCFLSESEQAEIIAVCDLSPAMARFAADRFGATHALTDYQRLLADLKPQVVHVLTPPHTHVQLVTECLEAGAHVIVEKPVAPTHVEFDRLWSLAKTRECRLTEDHNYRFNRPILEMEQRVAQGQLGEVREIDVRLALAIREPGNRYADANLPSPSHLLPGGVVQEFITHLCYLTLRFLPTFERVAAAWNSHGDGNVFKYDDLDAVVIGGPVHARIRFTCHTQPDCFTVTVRGTRGTAHTDLFQPHLLITTPRGAGPLSPVLDQYQAGRTLKRAAWANLKNKVLRRTPYEGLHTFLHRTYQALRRGGELPVTYEDMERTSRLIGALLDEANRI